MKVEVLVDAWKSNESFESRRDWIAKLASISYGNEEAKNPTKLVRTLIERGHQSLFEFIRCPYECPKSLTLKGYRIEDSLRHNLDLPTFEIIGSAWYQSKEPFIKAWKSTLVLLKITVPIFIDRQLVRHRSDSRIELSRRYVKPDKIEFSYWFPEDVSSVEAECFTEEMNQRYQRNLKRYTRAELARFDQPLNLYTTYYVMRDCRGAKNFYVRRFNKHAQKETRELVTKELQVLKSQYPDFLGQKVLVIKTDKGEPVYKACHILDLQKLGKEVGANKLYINYGDPHYYAVFDVEVGLFVDDVIIDQSTKDRMYYVLGVSEDQS